MEGWSSMRFCNMKCQDSIGHLENEIHFQRRRVQTKSTREPSARTSLCSFAALLQVRCFSNRAAKINWLMSTLTATVPVSRRSNATRFLLWLLLILFLLALGAVGYAYFVTRAALPRLDGSLRVNGLSASGKVTRDGHGVPAIEATSLTDLFLAQGYGTAQDRLWQLDVMRRFG